MSISWGKIGIELSPSGRPSAQCLINSSPLALGAFPRQADGKTASVPDARQTEARLARVKAYVQGRFTAVVRNSCWRSQLVLLPGLTISEKRGPVFDQLQRLRALERFANQEGATFFADIIGTGH